MRFPKPEELDNPYSARELVRDAWGFTRAHRGMFWFTSFVVIARELIGLYPAYAFSRIVSILGDSNRSAFASEVQTLLELYALCVLGQIALFYVVRLSSSRLIEGLGLELEGITITQLFGIRISWHEKENTGNKMKRMNNGVGGVQSVLRIWFNNILSMITNLVGAVFIISRFNGLTSVVLVLFMVSYYALSRSMANRSANAANAVTLQSEAVNGLEFQAMNNIRTVKVLGMSETLMQRVHTELATMREKVLRRVQVFQDRTSLLLAWSQFVRLGMLVYIIEGVFRGTYQVGFLLLFTDYFQRMRDIATQLSDLSQELTISRFSVSRLKQMLAEPITTANDDTKHLFPKRWKQLSLKHVGFTYGTEQVLSDISLTIQRGEKIGIVGLSGAGKSTLFKLLLKEYEDFSGSISFDKTSITNIKAVDYFRHVAVVLQDTEVFNFSVKENITLANDEQKDNEELLQRALEVSHVQDFLHKLPEGLDSTIGEKGVKLSGGERQRLGIARAVFKQPHILLLDEATSHLDVESEEKIKDSLNQFFDEVTAIVIAHRLTTVKAMDRIYVLEDGKILESGTFDELYKQKGRFYALWEKQKL